VGLGGSNRVESYLNQWELDKIYNAGKAKGYGRGKGINMMNGNTGRGIPAAKGGPNFGKGFALSYNVKGGGNQRERERAKGCQLEGGATPSKERDNEGAQGGRMVVTAPRAVKGK
jgi:hypothetical protein